MLDFSLQKKLHTAEGNMQLNIESSINQGDFVSLYGPSGAGKTSILRMLAGFMQPEKGFVKMDDIYWVDKGKKIYLTPQQRHIGFVFQDYALFPNMSVRQNISFSLNKNEPKDIVDELLQLTGLANLSDRKIQTLSGGQQQRVALARAIARKPKLLLLDEPLSAIDQDMRTQLQETLLLLHRKYGLTTILVSHDMNEIIKLSNKIIHLKNGLAQQYTTTTSFLNAIGYTNGLIGSILSIDKTKMTLFLGNTVVSFQFDDNNTLELKQGDCVEIIYDGNLLPTINKKK